MLWNSKCFFSPILSFFFLPDYDFFRKKIVPSGLLCRGCEWREWRPRNPLVLYEGRRSSRCLYTHPARPPCYTLLHVGTRAITRQSVALTTHPPSHPGVTLSSRCLPSHSPSCPPSSAPYCSLATTSLTPPSPIT